MSEDIQVTDGTILEALNNKVDLDGGNYKGSELEAYIHEHCAGIDDKITNCITSIPQRIKLDLSDGILTLKAGSTVIIPNGFEEDGTTLKFDYVTIETDKSGTYGANGYYYCYNPSQDLYGATTAVSSGSSVASPLNAQYWYDTTNNKVKRYLNNAWVEGYSLPFCVTSSNGFNAFNGMGYMGADLYWIDKGVTAICGQGTNPDGTIKNATYRQSNVEFTNNSGWNALTASASGYLIHIVTSKRNQTMFQPDYRFYTSLADPSATDTVNYSYIENEKQWYVWDGGNNNLFWEKAQVYIYADMTTKGGAFNPREVFRCLNKHEVVSKYGDTMTGPLKVQYPSASNYDYRATTAPSSPIAAGAYEICDKNGNVVTRMHNYLNIYNNVVTQISTIRNIGDANKAASLQLYVGADGAAKFDFPKCTTKATTTSTAHSGNVAVVVQNYVNGNAWMRKWSDGWIEQGGRMVVSYEQNVTTNFVTSFSNTNYYVTASPLNWQNIDDNINVTGLTTTSCKLYGTGIGNAGGWSTVVAVWYACGY